MKKILVPLDFGEPSEVIYRYALQLAQKMQSSLTLYHATHLPHTEREAIVEYEKTIDRMAVTSQKKLKHLIKEITPTEFSNVRVHTKVQVVDPVEGIVMTSSSLPANLIVIGMANRNKWDDFLFGSVCRDVLKTIEQPMVVLPPEFEIKTVENILYLFHYGISNLKNLQAIGGLAKEWEAALHCILVANRTVDQKELKRDEEKLQSICATEYQAKFSTISSVKNFEEPISDYVKQEGISLLAMENHDKTLQKLLHSGKETGIVRHFQLPVLFLPKPAV